jgi:phenylalanyl-tRNA synthetase beta chain
MLVSYNWIKEFVDTGLSVEDLGHELTMAGLEIEGIEAVGDDHVLEVNVTPNRPDALSLLGIARDLQAITGKPYTLPPHEIKNDIDSDFKVEILDEALCNRYAGRVVKGVKLAPSPSWMSQMLEKCGIRSINNIVDITNYVLLEFGHPLHAFDLSTLKGNTIRIGTAKQTSTATVRTLDGVERKLKDEALLILDAERAVAVAGVMGGEDTEVSDASTDIFIESAWFNPSSIRSTSKAMGLSTEASYRFERGTDIIMLEAALDRAAYLVAEIAGGTVHKIVDEYPVKPSAKPIPVRFKYINRVLGTDLKDDEIIGYMNSLKFDTKPMEGGFELTPPTYRPDITIETDIVEEVARLFGFENIHTELPKADISSMASGRTRKNIYNIRALMLQEGYHDAINYSFMNINDLDTLQLPQDDARRKCIEVLNPLRSEDAHMRTTLLPALMTNLVHNVSHGTRDLKLFELARVFIDVGEELPQEPRRLGAVYFKDDLRSLYPEQAEPFLVLKGSLENLLTMLRVKDVTYKRSEEPFLHPGKSAEVLIAGQGIGFIGVLTPKVHEALGIKSKQDIVMFELDLDALLAAIPYKPEYESITRYPSVVRDIALLVDDSVSVSDILALVNAHPCDAIEETSVFDLYKGKGIAEGKKSLAFNIRYRSAQKTFTDEEVEVMHKGLVDDLIKKTGAEVRGA